MPRLTAARALVAVDVDGAYANLVLPAMLRGSRLSARDRALATALTYGAVRLQGRYDAILRLAGGRPVAAFDPQVRACLRLGVHQLLDMRVPAHAAVSQTVAAARRLANPGAAGAVNAVLRRVAAHDADYWLARLNEIADTDERLAAVYAHPRQVVAALRAALAAHGRSGELEALLGADNRPPLVSLVARPGLMGVDELICQVHQRLDQDARPGELSPWQVEISGGDPARLPAVRAGWAGVQDGGSQLVAGVLANAPISGPDRNWLDLCAGPGGKTALLAGLGGPEVAVVANEVAEHRARLVEASCRALPNVTVRVGDGRDFPARGGGFDRVLVDAPCTGLGSLRRRPEARYRGRTGQVPELSQLQTQLLTRALELVRPGGVVGYATCSPHVAETLKVIERIDGARVLDAAAVANLVLPSSLRLTDGPHIQLWPHIHGCDAMFMALLTR